MIVLPFYKRAGNEISLEIIPSDLLDEPVLRSHRAPCCPCLLLLFNQVVPSKYGTVFFLFVCVCLLSYIRNKNNLRKINFNQNKFVNKEICLGDSQSSLLEKPTLASLISQYQLILIEYLCKKKYYVAHLPLCQRMLIGRVL